MPEDTTCDPAERGALERAFVTFNLLSSQLQQTYHALEQRVAKLTTELEDARRAREHAAAAAERTAQRLRSLLGTLPAGVVVVDEKGRIQETNRVAQEILGGDVAGMPWQAVARAVLANPLDAGGDWITRDGRRVTLAASSAPQEAAKIILITDVTETRALQELVTRNQRLSAIGKMAASLAHQIRTPLAGALLYFSQCRTRHDDTQRSALLEKGIDRLRHLERLIQDMLVFARGKGPGERVRIADLFRAVHDAALAVKPPNAHLIIQGDDAFVELDGNRTALTAALTNLVTNAFESSPDVVVTLRAQTRGERVELCVHDNGPGIAPSIQSRVFEPFFSTRPAGTGLGLAVVKTVAEAHGGALALESSQGRGTRIELDLPRRAYAPAPLDAEIGSESAAREVA
jgi:two-component system sensor histidine kinase FlrB